MKVAELIAPPYVAKPSIPITEVLAPEEEIAP